MKLKLGLSVALAGSILLLSGCNSTSESSDDRVAKVDNDLVCESRPTTGSNLRKRRCMSRQLAEQVQRENKDAMRQVEKKGRGQSHTRY
ncbi:hypothetical protein HG263_20685 [Pseudoalteromonas sp. JBTF-M23]|uniref:Entry exclusion lipoprotein TrbK n=1 Tax=Pseudoalteromonas caenipelagi TaxID=2726988 RepID=A0A849VMQ5_9GAMM|nr:hypothetical protein [Pseudoalteromonas caenipelagi]NOU52921.1 hypothetical protein [Pseudoalteromonas caenipelagi]